jgi:hypothetical protein
MTDQNDNQGLDWLDKNERKDARRRSAPKAAVVYEAIRREGEEELSRNTEALVWSGLAAGLSMGFSFLMEALLAGAASSTDLLVRFFIPTLLGNIVGGGGLRGRHQSRPGQPGPRRFDPRITSVRAVIGQRSAILQRQALVFVFSGWAIASRSSPGFAKMQFVPWFTGSGKGLALLNRTTIVFIMVDQ